MARPRKPENALGPQGRELWDSVTSDSDLETHERVLLIEACRVVDRLQFITDELEGAPATVVNNKGDEVAHPLLAEARQQEQTLARLVASLRLPMGEEGARPQRRGAARGTYGIRGVVS